MKLRARLTSFTVFLVLLVLIFSTAVSVFTIKYFLSNEVQITQQTWIGNFKKTLEESLYSGDDLAIQSYGETLERTIPELGYAVFVDQSRGAILLGGLESIQRFKKLSPECKGDPVGNTNPPVLISNITSEGNHWHHYCQNLELVNLVGGKVHGTIQIGFSVNAIQIRQTALIKKIVTPLIGAMLIILLVGVFLAFMFSKQLTRPIAMLTEGAKSIGDGNLETQIPVHSKDELGFLAKEFNLMANKLKELDQLKDDFVSSVSHELRSPLSAISGYVELLTSKPFEEISPEKRMKALSIIQESTARLTHFINDILDLAKIKSGHTELRQEAINLNETAEDVIALLHPLFEKKNVQSGISIPHDLPEAYVDDEKLRQILVNLISNALKFTPSGGKIIIRAKNQGGCIQMSVEDTGIGISDDAKSSIFDRFKQAKGSNQVSGQKGSGLGLAIVKGYVEAHGGEIWVDSEVGKGTAINFTLAFAPVSK
ncbi:MAG: ATP-binding protein [Elusimicrobiota bacterium]